LATDNTGNQHGLRGVSTLHARHFTRMRAQTKQPPTLNARIAKGVQARQ
jgi:hypothetical protein